MSEEATLGHTSMTQASTTLWEYACEFYGQEPVKERCLHLQYVYGANVNVILWLCWLDANEWRLAPEVLDEALAIVNASGPNILKSLRELREQLAMGSNFTRVQQQLIRKHMLAAELAIEKIVLQRLQDLTARVYTDYGRSDNLSLRHYLERTKTLAAGEEASFFKRQQQASGQLA